MRIAFIGQKGIPCVSGGIEKHVEDLSVALAERGHDILVYTRPHYTPKELDEYRGVRLQSLPSIRSKRLDAISHTLLSILDMARRDVDIVHFHGIGPSSLIWLARLLKPRAKIISTFHCQDYFHKKWGLFARLYLRLGEWFACHMAHMTITVSRSLTDYVLKTYRKATTYIPNGVHLAIPEEPSLIKRWELEKGNYILAVSRLIRHKGIHRLVEAYSNIISDKKLVIVGSGSFTDEYVQELKEKASADPRILMTGAQNGKALRELLTNAYLFVQPSESEGLSIALLEAMAYGKAVLVSDIAENLEAIGDAGFSFRNLDTADLTAKISLLLEDENITDQAGDKAQKHVTSNYNWQEIVAATEKVYENAVARNVSGKFSRLKMASRLATFL